MRKSDQELIESVIHLAKKLARGDEDAEQEAIMAAIRRLPSYDPQKGAFSAYVYLSMRRAAMETISKHYYERGGIRTRLKRTSGYKDLPFKVEEMDALDDLDRLKCLAKDSHEPIDEHIADLPQKCRDMIRLKLEGFTWGEISEQLELPIATLYYYLKQLRERYQS